MGFAQNYSNIEFIENKGQWDKNVKYKGDLSNGALFLEKDGYTVLQHNADDLKNISDFYHAHRPITKDETLILRSHAYKVKFLNASSQYKQIPDKKLSYFNNYFIGNDQEKWAADCKLYQAVTYENIYPNVDVRYYTSNQNVKYDIIVKPGADINKIALQYNGTDNLKIKAEELNIKTSVAETKELSPYSYQIINGIKTDVKVRYKLSGNILTFKIENYNNKEVLVIDPTLIFSTFTGSVADNWGYTATPGPNGSFISGGIVFGTGYPVTAGAFQTTFQGGVNDEGIGVYDIGIMKFSSNGANRDYATYLGGSGNEQPHSLIADAAGNVVIAGRTNSANFPTTVATFGSGGNYDIFITKLNATGTGIIGSRKFGGSGIDGINIRSKYAAPTGGESIRRNYGDDSRSEVIIDGSGNIILASCTQSADFLTTAGVFQGTNGGGRQDGVIVKVSPDISSVLFSTYLGGIDDDAAFVLSINPSNGNIYVGGGTVSNNFPGTNGSSLFPSFQAGVCDGFVSIINPTATSLIKSTYIGTDGADLVYGIQFDKFGFPYIMGTTTGAWPILNAAFNQLGGKQFISKLQPDLSAWVYSTVFGPNALTPNISPVAFLVDKCQNVYVSGWGGSVNTSGTPNYPNATTTGLPVTPDALKASTDGSDFYFFVLERNATSQLYGSFFGQTGGNNGEHVDGGTSRFDASGIIYQALCANCGGGAAFPTTPGVVAPSNGSQNCNLAAVKIAFNLAGILTSVQSSINGIPRDTSGCVPLTVDFNDTIGIAQKYIWSFGDGSASVTTTVPTVAHTYNNVGTYNVTLIAIDSLSCNISDTAYTSIRVRNDDAILGFVPTKLPPCQSFTYQFANTSFVPTGKPFKNNSFKWNFGDNTTPIITGNQTINHVYAGPGTYKVKLFLVDTNFCNEPDSLEIEVRIAANVKAQFTTPATGCAPYNAAFNNTSLAGSTFLWDFGNGNTSNQTNPTQFYNTPGTYTIKLIAIDSSTCNIIDSSQFSIIVSSKPTASFTYSPIPPQTNTPVTFTNNSLGGTNFKWNFGDGDSILINSVAPVQHTYNATGKFNTCLIAINNFGCSDTSCQEIEARIIPILDVPNAFTPNGDGINDKIFVRGFGIEKMTWRIYNRWGKQVFFTTNRLEGWDGTVNGILQPMEVYHYILDIEFTDKTTTQKKGDITLIR